MIIIHDRPPLWDLISAKFDVAGKPVLIAWGDRVYNPEGIPIPRELHAHEEIHGSRQAMFHGRIDPRVGFDVAVEQWWHEYIASPDFRLQEEIPAHVAELRALVSAVTDRNTRDLALRHVARKLASPLYGRLITPQAARELLLRSVR